MDAPSAFPHEPMFLPAQIHIMNCSLPSDPSALRVPDPDPARRSRAESAELIGARSNSNGKRPTPATHTRQHPITLAPDHLTRTAATPEKQTLEDQRQGAWL
jgi:hypothetical protein